jgi:ferritin-like metal-binding protein YciE
MATHNLKEALVTELRDLLDAERQIRKGLKKMAGKASDPDLKKALEDHMEETEEQVERLEQTFEALGQKARGKHCPGIAGILEEAEEMLEEADSPELRDAVLIAGAQKVEHYEIAAYGTVCTWAEQLELETVDLLRKTLEEEKETDAKLTKFAQHLNLQVAAGLGAVGGGGDLSRVLTRSIPS